MEDSKFKIELGYIYFTYPYFGKLIQNYLDLIKSYNMKKQISFHFYSNKYLMILLNMCMDFPLVNHAMSLFKKKRKPLVEWARLGPKALFFSQPS